MFLITLSWFRERHDVTQAHHENFQEAQAGPARKDRNQEIQGVVSLIPHPQWGECYGDKSSRLDYLGSTCQKGQCSVLML